MLYVWVTFLQLHYVSALILALLYFCVRVTRDYRLRVKLHAATAALEPDELYAQYRHAMWIVGLYAVKPFRPVVPHRTAEVALVLTTVLRERIYVGASQSPPRSYLRSRRQLIAEAKHYVRAQAAPKPN